MNDFQAGYLIVKRFEKMYYEYVYKYNLKIDFYGLPRLNKLPSEYKTKYHGIDREPLDLFCELKINDLEDESRFEDDFIFSYDDVISVLSKDKRLKANYDVIWVKIAGSSNVPPDNFVSIGFEPSYFYGDHFSAVCDCMFIPRWHGTDEEGVLFKKYYDALNIHGLFNTSTMAEEFLNFYLSFDWTERGDFYITEVFKNSKK